MGGKSGNEALERAFSSSLCTGLRDSRAVSPRWGRDRHPPVLLGCKRLWAGRDSEGGKLSRKGKKPTMRRSWDGGQEQQRLGTPSGIWGVGRAPPALGGCAGLSTGRPAQHTCARLSRGRARTSPFIIPDGFFQAIPKAKRGVTAPNAGKPEPKPQRGAGAVRPRSRRERHE